MKASTFVFASAFVLLGAAVCAELASSNVKPGANSSELSSAVSVGNPVVATGQHVKSQVPANVNPLAFVLPSVLNLNAADPNARSSSFSAPSSGQSTPRYANSSSGSDAVSHVSGPSYYYVPSSSSSSVPYVRQSFNMETNRGGVNAGRVQSMSSSTHVESFSPRGSSSSSSSRGSVSGRANSVVVRRY